MSLGEWKKTGEYLAWRSEFKRLRRVAKYKSDLEGHAAAVAAVPMAQLRNIEWMNKKDESGRDQWFCEKTARLLATHYNVEVFIVTDGAFDVVAYNTDGSNKKHMTVIEMAPTKESVVLLHNGTDHFDGLRYMGPG